MTHGYLAGLVTATFGDITQQRVDAIVNAANSSLLGGGGVDGAIHAQGGPQILAECQALRRTAFPSGLPTGEVALTTGGRLPARHVIHTVGPVYGRHAGQEAPLLASCYRRSIVLAQEKGFESLAFPAISTGVFGYPRAEAAAVASAALAEALAVPGSLRDVRLVFYSAADLAAFVEHQRFQAG
jgi:O-acetyl-ADP-ribose deacetylase (regulator of RNase III)